MGERNVTNYTLTSRAKQGFQRVGSFLHIEGMDNIISFIVWNMLDIEPVSVEQLEHARESCLKRLNYVRTPERVTVAISMSKETKLKFEQMYVAAGIGSMSAALDLLGSSVVENGWAETEKYQFVNDFENPFYVYRKDNYVCFRALNTEPLKKAPALMYDKDGIMAAERLVMEPDGSITSEPDMSDSFRAVVPLESDNRQPGFKKISAYDENGKPCSVYVGKVTKEMLDAIEADKMNKVRADLANKLNAQIALKTPQAKEDVVAIIDTSNGVKVKAVAVKPTGKRKLTGHRKTLQQLQAKQKSRFSAPGSVVVETAQTHTAIQPAHQMDKMMKKGGPMIQSPKPSFKPVPKSNLGHLLGS